MLKQTMTTKQ